MSEPKWTRGPWVASQPYPRGNFLIEQPQPDGLIIGRTFGGKAEAGITRRERKIAIKNEEANADLMASAPELYEALEELAAIEDGDDGFGLWNHSEKFSRARAALAKARGESQ